MINKHLHEIDGKCIKLSSLDYVSKVESGHLFYGISGKDIAVRCEHAALEKMREALIYAWNEYLGHASY